MKAWLGAAFRLLVDFLVILFLIAVTEGFASSLTATSLAALPGLMLRSALDRFPYALAAASALGLFAFRKRQKSLLLGFVSVILLGAVLAAGGLALRLIPLSPLPPLLSLPPTNTPIEVGEVLLSASSYEESGTARDVLSYDTTSPFPRFHYAAETRYLPDQGALLVGGQKYPVLAASNLFRSWERMPEFLSRPPLKDLAALSYPQALLVALGFVILVVGLTAPALGPRWPLTGLALGVLGVGAAFILDAALNGATLSALLKSAAASLGLGLLPSALLAALVEGVIGLLAGFSGIGVGKRRAP